MACLDFTFQYWVEYFSVIDILFHNKLTSTFKATEAKN